MSAGGSEYTFYFAWVPQGTPWDLSLARSDETVFDLLIEHDEGQIPTATIEIINPRIGFISPTRLYWAWISFSFESCPPQPLFFGRLVGIPEEITNNTVKVKFLARDPRYVYMKQQVARSLKTSPNYDPIFFDQAKRDDPDTILEGWSALYHVDRVNNLVSASDILIGEDGTIVLASQDVFYDSVQCKLLQPPLAAVNVKAEVNWEQQYRGAYYLGSWSWPTLGSDAFVGDWPKTGSGLGGGWTAAIAWAGERDPGIIQSAEATAIPPSASSTFSWQNKNRTHENGDTMSLDISQSSSGAGGSGAITLSMERQSGLVDPYATDEDGKPAPINIPAKVNTNWFTYKTYALNFLGKESVATLSVTYKADRKRNEQLEMTVKADVQPVLIDPLVTEDTEQITLKSSDLSLPLVDLLNWDSVGMGGRVELGQFIYPDNPLVPGQTSSQICVQAGNTGMEEPVFSNISGETTVDGSVIWASYGDTAPVENANDWVRLARVPLGALLLPLPISGLPSLGALAAPGQLNYPPSGTAATIFSMYDAGGSVAECIQSGLYGGIGQGQHAAFSFFQNPSGMFLYICVRAGTTGFFHTSFNETPGSQTLDGSVIWQNIGRVGLPIGGWPGMTPASTYFTTDRGQESIQHMMCRARAKLRKRARAVEVSFDTRFEVAAQLSCRMNCHLSDPRLPGGQAYGKVVSYKLEAHGDSGELKGSVVFGCSIGTADQFGGRAAARGTPDPGMPSYVQEGYVQKGYQQYYSTKSGAPPGTLVEQNVEFPNPVTPPNWPTLPSTLPPDTCPPLNSYWSPNAFDWSGSEMGYTPPPYAPNDDGVIFGPEVYLTNSSSEGTLADPSSYGTSLILVSAWHGTASTINPGNVELYNLQLQQVLASAVPQNTGAVLQIPGVTLDDIVKYGVPNIINMLIALETAVVTAKMVGTGLWYELVLRPVTNGPFSSYYVIDTSDLLLPKTIDLSAPSSGLARGGLLSHAPRT